MVARTNQKDRCFFCRELSRTVSRQDVHCISERSRTVPYKRLIKQILRRRATTQGRPYAHPQNNIRFQITVNLDNSVIFIFAISPTGRRGRALLCPCFVNSATIGRSRTPPLHIHKILIFQKICDILKKKTQNPR